MTDANAPRKTNTGPGRCHIELELEIVPTADVIAVGSVPDVRKKVLSAVHHVNRTGDADDYLAVAFPEITDGYSRLQAGDRTLVFGSRKAIERLSNTLPFNQLKRRAMAKIRMSEVDFDADMPGKAFVRDRTQEKRTRAGINRRIRRDARHDTTTRMNREKPKSDFSELLSIFVGGRPLNLREVEGSLTSKEVMVSTYGFSRTSAPAYLPV